MHLIDQYAYANRMRAVDPAQKAVLAGLVIALCLGLKQPLVNLLALGWMWGLTTFWAGLPARTFGRVILAEGFFLLLSVVGIVVSVSLSLPPATDWRWQIGSIWVSSSPAALELAFHLVSRSLGAASAMNFLALTTPLVDMLELFRRWHLPSILVDIMVIIYRFIFVLLDSLNTMYVAQDSRLGYQTSYWRAMNSAALLGSRLFINAFQRSRRLQIALESRGYEGGDLQVLPSPYQSDPRIVWLGLVIALSMLLVWLIA